MRRLIACGLVLSAACAQIPQQQRSIRDMTVTELCHIAQRPDLADAANAEMENRGGGFDCRARIADERKSRPDPAITRLALQLIGMRNSDPYPTIFTQQHEQLVVCAKYWTKSGLSHGYSMPAEVIPGFDLNTREFTSKYSTTKSYVVINWPNAGRSVIDVGQRLVGLSSVSGTDQEGRSWEISTPTICQ
jgi:hypothetical protein